MQEKRGSGRSWLLPVALAALLGLTSCRALLMARPNASPPVDTGAPAEIVHMAVCWGAVPLAEDLRAAYTGFRTGVSIEIVPMSSAQAQTLLASGQVDLAIACAPQQEPIPVEPPLEWKLVAHDSVAIVVNRELPLSQLTAAELERLYAGYVADWAQLDGGEGRPILIVQGADATARQVFDRGIMREREISTAAQILPHDAAVLAFVREHPLAIGYLSAAYLEPGEGVKVIALDRLLPTRTQSEQGGYPLRYDIYLGLAPEATEEAARLAAFAQSRAGREVIGQRYGLPR